MATDHEGKAPYKLHSMNCFQFSFTWRKRFILHTRDSHLRDTSPTTSGSLLLRVVPHSEETRFYIYFISRRSIEDNNCLAKPMRTLHLHISIYMFQTPSIQLPLCNNVIHPIGIQPHCTVVKILSTNS